MRVKLLYLLALSCLVFTETNACLNTYEETNLAGQKDTIPHDDFPVYYRTFNRDFSQHFVDSYDLRTVSAHDYKTRSDIAFHLARLGRYAESLSILQALYQLYPQEYNIMSNLGTVYELNGQNQEALTLIKQGVKLFPQGHQGSEWFHVKVLEAKLTQAKDPTWLFSHQVLNLGIHEPSIKYRAVNQEDGVNLDELFTPLYHRNLQLLKHVKYQLHERIPFTAAPDLLLANVLNELADALAVEFSIEEAYIFYQMALAYDPADTYQVREKVGELIKVFHKLEVPVPTSETVAYHFPPLDKVPLIEKHKKEYISAHEKVKRLIQLEESIGGASDPKSNEWYWGGGMVLVMLVGIVVYRNQLWKKERVGR
jgi:tetratricopeptide (TPR) repeat protein